MSSNHEREALPDTLILDSLGEALLAVDDQGRIVRFTESAEQLTGFAAMAVLGRSCTEALRASACFTDCPVKEAMRTGRGSHTGVTTLRTAADSPLTVELTASALLDPDGKVIGAVGLLRDASEGPAQVRVYGSRLFVSRTEAMRRVFDALPKLASSDAPLLVAGESGSGRGALAETVHLLGARGDRPLLHLRCRRDTDARGPDLDVDDASWSKLRHSGGTLLLEDVDQAGTDLQLRLLSWLEEEAAGSTVRLISTAGREVEARVETGALRGDLYYRLGVLHVALPSLHQRVDDIPLLVAQFIEDLNLERGAAVEGLSSEAMQRLLQADFPENVRQLRAVVAAAHARCRGARIELAQLDELAPGAPPSGDQPPSWQRRKADLEQAAIRRALRRAQGNISRAAAELQMHRTTLWRKLKRYKISS